MCTLSSRLATNARNCARFGNTLLIKKVCAFESVLFFGLHQIVKVKMIVPPLTPCRHVIGHDTSSKYWERNNQTNYHRVVTFCLNSCRNKTKSEARRKLQLWRWILWNYTITNSPRSAYVKMPCQCRIIVFRIWSGSIFIFCISGHILFVGIEYLYMGKY